MRARPRPAGRGSRRCCPRARVRACSYEARLPEDIAFRPLGEEKEFSAPQLMEHYRKDTKVGA